MHPSLQLMPFENEEWAENIQAGDARAIARAITAIERGEQAGTILLKHLFRLGRRALTIGVTGAPGVGKSTLVEKLAVAYRAEGRRVGILAVDASSPYTGGALLGDRIRMQRLAADDGIYIRSMASRGHLGGLASATHDAATVLEAAGIGIVLIETVGVGQGEIEIASLADATLLLLVPGLGDDVQSLKAGIMEVADVFVINKSDRAGAEIVEREVLAMLSLAKRKDAWQPPVVRTVATSGEGIAGVQQSIVELQSFLDRTFAAGQRERGKWRARIMAMLREDLLARAVTPRLKSGLIEELASEVAERRLDPHSAVEEIVLSLTK
jgi:LAO/AO transport system kinase